jgi:hypothetical protein
MGMRSKRNDKESAGLGEPEAPVPTPLRLLQGQLASKLPKLSSDGEFVG